MHNFEEIPAGLGSAVPLWWNGGRSFEAPPELVDIFATSTMEGPTVKKVEGKEEEEAHDLLYLSDWISDSPAETKVQPRLEEAQI